ncbi:expressed unknown protein [Seminavis robusta]|uniref:Uncharacterized protein n=1 Tax=Seminavis robusta TaxID=568900 RepID=A0A9N8D6I2_9STRA|nr:expressed unknown protein [Seminavis robusta]|eukprot:Sro19_g013230.1 n/a (93) ;mRNA; r:17284-17562
MMKSILSLLLVAVAVSGFAHPQPVKTTSTTLQMGLFDGFKPKKKEPEPNIVGGMDANVFGGKGKKITIRDDEDNAMWIDEDDSGNRKPAKGK